MSPAHDAVVVGSGPNGLAAAITLAQAGRSVIVYEAQEQYGGGMRTELLTLPGFLHDSCSSAHPLAVASAFFRDLPLQRHGLEFVHPDAPMAHPLEGRDAILLERSVDDTAAQMSDHDGRVYRSLFGPLARDAESLLADLVGPLQLPHHPIADMRFGLSALWPADKYARLRFHDEGVRGYFCGLAAHSMLPLDSLITTSFGLMLGLLGHAVGWPFARGGSQAIAESLVAHLRSLGGEVVTGREVRSLDDAGAARAVMLDVTPRQVLRIAGDALPPRYTRALRRFRYGCGVFKVDWALDGPVPWSDPRVLRAGTVHVGGTGAEVVAAEAAVGRGEHPERPFVLCCQQTLFDQTRAPSGQHTLWGYCHVPNGSTVDMTARIEAQIERFAPGFRNRILARSVRFPSDIERHDANMIGGDINGGSQDWRQLFTRPAVRPLPYTTPDRRIYVCSSSTPPGGGVHGLCGMFAAKAALRRAF